MKLKGINFYLRSLIDKRQKISADIGSAIRNEENLVIVGEGRIESKTSYAIRVQKGSLHIDTDKIEVVSDFGAVSMFNDAQVTIEGGTYTVNGVKGKTHYRVYLYSGADQIINGGSFVGSCTYIRAFHKCDSNCYINVNAGTFTNVPQSMFQRIQPL